MAYLKQHAQFKFAILYFIAASFRILSVLFFVGEGGEQKEPAPEAEDQDVS